MYKSALKQFIIGRPLPNPSTEHPHFIAKPFNELSPNTRQNDIGGCITNGNVSVTHHYSSENLSLTLSEFGR